MQLTRFVCHLTHLKYVNNDFQLANQFVASIYYVHKHHDLQTLGPADTVRQQQKNEGEDPGDRNGRGLCSTLHSMTLG